MQYNTKIVQTGTEIEITRHSIPVQRGSSKRTRRNTKGNKVQQELSKFERDKRDRYTLKKSLSRTCTNLRQLINCNTDCDRFVTLTFNREVYDINTSSPIFTKFIQRLKYRLRNIIEKIKYIAVPEFQPISKRVHYHLLINKYIEFKVLEKIWGNGYIKIEKVRKKDRMGNYMTKYLTKDSFDKRYKSKRKFLYSRNCNKPKTTYGEYAEAMEENIKKIAKPSFTMDFKENKYVGKTKKIIYKIKDLPPEYKESLKNSNKK